jgi:hypothetical protein
MKATKKILGAAAALVLSLGIATGSTYAWFASNSTATVDSFEVGVTSSTDNLLVAIGDTSVDSAFKSKITNAEIVAEIQKNIDSSTNPTTTAKLDALTSTDNGINFYTKAEAAKEDDSDNSTSGTKTEISSGKFITFTLTFRSYTALSLMLDSTSAVTASATNNSSNLVVAWANSDGNSAVTTSKYGIDSDLAVGAKIAARAANAARVSFVTGTSDSQTSKVWSPNEALVSGGQATANSDSRGKGYWKGNLASDYNTHMSGDAAVTQRTYTSTVTPLATAGTYNSESEIVALSSTTSATLGTVYQAAVTVNIWLEGTDGDCLDSIFSDSFSVALNFVALAVKS